MKAKKYELEFSNIALFLPFGHLAEERELGQRIYIDIVVKLDSKEYSTFNELSSVYDYTKIEKTLRSVITKREYHFLEEISEVIAEDLLKNDNSIMSVMITIRKPSVPVDLVLDYASSSMEFFRE